MRTMKNAIHMLNNSDIISRFPGQMNSFVVEMEDGEIVVIDGGYRGECKYLLHYLQKISNKSKPVVSGWFLTHPHQDHIGCFMEIMEHYSEDIEVKHVYYNFPSIQFLQDEPRSANTIREFYRLLPRFADRAIIVSQGDCYKIGDAVFDVLYTTNPQMTANRGNNSSLVFRLTIEEKKALFLGDIGTEVSNYLVEKYGENLKSEYVQMAHHGQAGAAKNLYIVVNPRVCLWCTPVWLWEDDMGQGYHTHGFQTIEVREWMDELNVEKHYVMKDGDQVIEFRKGQ